MDSKKPFGLAKYPLVIKFSESAEEEVYDISKNLGLEKILEALVDEEEPFPEALREPVERILAFISDILNVGLPGIDGPPEMTLRRVSRDYSLSRLFRERGLVRLYRFVRSSIDIEIPIDEFGNKQTVEVKAFQTLINPITNGYFSSQEEFIKWFCKDASISRASVFSRFALFDRMIYTLKFPLEEAYRIIISRPYVIDQTIKELADWDGTEIKHIDPDKAMRLASAVLPPDERDEIVNLALKIKKSKNSKAIETLKEAIIPAIKLLLEQVSEHESVKEVMNHVRSDILKEPEIYYTWDDYLNGLHIEMIIKGIDETGTENVEGKYKATLLPNNLEEIPSEVRNDLIKKLHIFSP